MNRILRRVLVTGMVLVTLGTLPAFGYRMIQNTATGTVSAGNLVPCNDPGGFTHWTTSTVYWYHNTAGQGSGKATALQNAMASWTNVANADHTLIYAGTTAAGWATDGQNTVLWASGNGCTGSCLALTALTLQSGQVIVETDVTFNSAYSWQTNGTNYDTEAVAAHEFGHTLGIHHTEVTGTPQPTMYATYFGTGGRSLEADDIAALQCAHNMYFGGATSRRYICGYALPGYNCNNGRRSSFIQVGSMSVAIPQCRDTRPSGYSAYTDFCYVIDADGAAPTDSSQCAAAGGSWRPNNNCCNFKGTLSCPW